MKKGIGLALSTVLFAAGALSGCAEKNGEGSASSSPAGGAEQANKKIVNNGVELTPPGTFPIVNQKVTLKVFYPEDPSIEDLNTNELTKEYEAKTNVHIEWISVPSKDLEQKRNLLLSSNSDMPDIFLNTSISNAQQVQFGTQGVLLPLNDLIEREGINFKKVLDYKPIIKKVITAPDGKIYALPSIGETYHTTLGQKLWINKTWLDKLNLKAPTTTDELYNVLKAFKEKDPNGNGKADEIPLTGATNGYNLSVYHFIMNAFIQDQGFDQVPFILENGKVSVAFDKPQWQEGLRYLHKLYSEGLIDKGAITQDSTQLKQIAANKDVNLLGAVSAGAMTGFLANGTPRMEEYTSLAPLKGPAGVQTTGYYPYQVNTGKFAISASTKYPDVALRWADWFYSQEGTFRALMGREGTEWRKANAEEKGMNGQPGSTLRILIFGKTQNVHWNQLVPIFYPQALRDSAIADPKDQENILFRETKEKYEPYKPKDVLPPLFMTGEESEEYLTIDYAIKDYLKQTMAKFTVGNLDIEKDWNSYLQQLDKIGLKRYVELNQKAYDRGYKK